MTGVPWTERVISLLERTPRGMTSAELGRQLGVTSDGASKVAQKLFAERRIDRELIKGGGVSQFSIWKAKIHA